MKTAIKVSITLSAVMVAIMVNADGSAIFDGGWRLSAGAVYDFGAKATGRLCPRQGYVSPYRAGLSRAEAEKLGGGTRSGTRLEFANGAWIDTNDPVCEEGDDFGKTRFYKFPAATWDGSRTFALGSADYSEVNTFIPAAGSFDRAFSDDSGMLGVNIELSRNLYHDEDYGWGLDMALAFQYFKHNGLLSLASRWFNGASTHAYGTRASGLRLDNGKGTYSKCNWSPDGSFYGSGGVQAGPGRYVDETTGEDVYAGPISFDLDDLGGRDFFASDASYGSMRANGDYENMELILLVRPYYDIFEWLRISATLGLVVSRQDLDLTMFVMRDERLDYRSSRDFSQWDVYGVAGGGLMLYYKDFTLSVDILARFLDDDLDFSGRYVEGEVQRGRVMLKLSIGYEF